MATLDGDRLTIWIAVVGPSGAGKRTTLEQLQKRISKAGTLVKETTQESQDLVYFEFPLGAQRWGSLEVWVRLLTLSGRVFYDSDREKLIKGSSGAILVASLEPHAQQSNVETRDNLDRHVGDRALMGYPVLLQCNRSDLPDALPAATLELGDHIGAPIVTAAVTGEGMDDLAGAITSQLVPAAMVALTAEGIVEPVATLAADFVELSGPFAIPASKPKAPARKPLATKKPAKKPPAKKSPAKKPPAKKPPATKKPAKKLPAKPKKAKKKR